MHNSNQNRQLNSTGAVPKAGSSREPQRDVVSRVVAPIVRETPHHNINSYNMVSFRKIITIIFFLYAKYILKINDK